MSWQAMDIDKVGSTCPDCAEMKAFPAEDFCNCGSRKRTEVNQKGYRFFLGQHVRFFNKSHIDSGGIILHISEDKGDKVTLGYNEKNWSHERYNESHDINRVAPTSEELSSDKRSRRPTQILSPPLGIPKRDRIDQDITKKNGKPLKKIKKLASKGDRSVAADPVVSFPRTSFAAPVPVKTKKSFLEKPAAQSKMVATTKGPSTASKPSPTSAEQKKWILDCIINQDILPSNEHDSCIFNSELCKQSRLCCICDFDDVESVLCRIRFVEGCSEKLHRGKSRLDRCQQRALLHIIYQNARASIPVRNYTENTFASFAFLSRGKTPSQPQHRLRWNCELGRVNCTKLTLRLVEMILWLCPTSVQDFLAIPGIMNKIDINEPFLQILSDLVKEFLQIRNIVPCGDFFDVLACNFCRLQDMFFTNQEADYKASQFCALCPTDKQIGKQKAPYSQEIFNAMQPTFPLSYDQFSYAMHIVYGLFDGREMVEGYDGIHGITNVKSTKQRTMFGSLNENLVEDIFQRTGLNSFDTFADLGSGIGQICIQASATTCCRSFGYEIDQKRLECSKCLLEHFAAVLKAAGIQQNMQDLVTFKHQDFLDDPNLANADVLVFNNFARWFQSDNPGKVKCYNTEVGKRCLDLSNGSQLVVLTELVNDKTWFPSMAFDPPINPCFTWTPGDDLKLYHYRKLADTWPCPTEKCNALTPNSRSDQCINGHVVKTLRSRPGAKRAYESSEAVRCGSSMSACSNGSVDVKKPRTEDDSKAKKEDINTDSDLDAEVAVISKSTVSPSVISFPTDDEAVSAIVKQSADEQKLLNFPRSLNTVMSAKGADLMDVTLSGNGSNFVEYASISNQEDRSSISVDSAQELDDMKKVCPMTKESGNSALSLTPPSAPRSVADLCTSLLTPHSIVTISDDDESIALSAFSLAATVQDDGIALGDDYSICSGGTVTS